MPTGSEIREKFLRFFESKGHRRVHSSSLVPANDPTLLFTNAGMNQFKDVFLGVEKRDYNKATTSQKCVRAGGKHNDLENVGFTKRHHTFFEMLGNFSFGSYFKAEAISYAWELVTASDWFGVPRDKLYVTIFKGEQGIPRDDDAEKHWLDVGVAKERIFAMGMKDNFWSMGDTGPCGPCSEIFYDMGAAASDEGHADCKFPCDCGRYVEIWNLVFMQFDRDNTGTLNPLPKPSIDTGMGLERTAAVLQGVISNYDTDLFTPLIQAAYGYTRPGNVDVDTKKDFDKAQKLPVQKMPLEQLHASLRIVADHSRACTFLISDGVLPANEGRGYVLRKILRRGIRHGRLLGATKPFMCDMVYAVRDLMKDAYPELVENADRVSKIVFEEERRFAHTLDAGLARLEADLQALRKEKADSQRISLSRDPVGEQGLSPAELAQHQYQSARGLRYRGEDAFKLYDTFGLPFDFIMDTCRDAGISVDVEGFERAMEAQRERARASWKGGAKQSASKVYQNIPPTMRSVVALDFLRAQLNSQQVDTVIDMHGKGLLTTAETRDLLTSAHALATEGKEFNRRLQEITAAIKNDAERQQFTELFEKQLLTPSHEATIVAIVANGAYLKSLEPGEKGEIFLDRTPFYAESGGQVGDRGWLLDLSTNEIRAEVEDCYFPVQNLRAHKAVAKSVIRVGDSVLPRIDESRRESIMRNHTATHLLHAALRETLGGHVKQAGSLVDPGHLRFDFSHFAAVADEELQDIEDMINKEVLRNIKVETIEDVPIDVAINEYRAMALFGEKYGERVRVVRIGDFSTELCGGTHTAATGEIGLIKILNEGSVSSGVRRVEAISGEGSLKHFRLDHKLENVVATLVPGSHKAGSPAEALRTELDKKDTEIKKLQKELEQLRMKSAASNVASVSEKARDIKGVKVVAQRVDNLDRGQMRTLVDNMRNKLGSGVVVLGSVQDGKVALIVGVTADLTARVQAGKVIKPVAEKVGGSGGGRPDMAEAGGKDPAQLDAALNEAYAAVEGLLK